MDEVEQLREMVNRSPEATLSDGLPLGYRKKLARQAIRESYASVYLAQADLVNNGYSNIYSEQNEGDFYQSDYDRYLDAKAAFAQRVDTVQVELGISQKSIERIIRWVRYTTF